MIDYFSAIYTTVATHLREKRPGITVTGEVSDQVAKFPCAQIEEVENIAVQQDNGETSLYARIKLRVRVYSNKQSVKVTEARAILSDTDEVLEPLNFRRKTFVTQNGLYNNSAYRIEATYEAVVDANGVLYRR